MIHAPSAATPTAEVLAPFVEDSAEEPRLPQRAYAVLRRAIRELKLAPGQMVLEKDAAAALGISRTPVREALVRLEGEGLLQLVPRHGFVVASVSPRDQREIREIMVGLEGMAVALAARRAPAEGVAALEAAVRDQESALSSDDLLGWAAADERFHHLVAELSGNARLHLLIQSYDNHLHRARLLTMRLRPKPVPSTADHRAVLEAIRRGDAERARVLHQAHRERGGAEILRVLEAMTPGGA